MSKSSPAAQKATEEEIDQIMGELEKLKGEMGADDGRPNLKVVPDADASSEGGAESQLTDFQPEPGDASMEDHLGEMENEHPDAGLLDPSVGEQHLDGAHPEDANKVNDDEDFESFDEMDSQEGSAMASQGEGTLSLDLSGTMRLKLKYEMNGQEVTVGFQGDFLQVTLGDGTEFKVPVKK